jgi:prepilin-type N-terminal cleavage/methylation domain-containing protein
MSYNQKKSGFTIVELLIVVVVIAILAAITIVSYNGIRQRAVTSAMQSELSQAVKSIESAKVLSGTDKYPSTQAAAALPTSTNGTVSYFYEASDNSYCVQILRDGNFFVSTSAAKNPTSGTCSASGLIGWWRMNGTTADSSGNGNNGTGAVITSVTGENNTPNSAYAFSYNNNSSITIPSTASLNTEVQTFTMWVKPTDWSSPTASVLMSKRDGTNGYFIAYVAATSTINFDCGSTSQRWNTNYVPPTNNTWTHLAFSCSLDGRATFYVNGTYIGEKTGINRANISTSAPLRIGRESNDSLMYNFNGSIDDARIYNRVLNDGEVKAIYDAHAQ